MKHREFSSEVFYLTEHEADVHGIAFGQHLVDGKLEGLSVLDMKVEKRRAIRRFPIQFPTTISDQAKHEGSGLLLDISFGGMPAGQSINHDPKKTVELQIQVPGWERPVVIDGAHVRWVKGQVVGIAFVRMRKAEQQRLEKVSQTRKE